MFNGIISAALFHTASKASLVRVDLVNSDMQSIHSERVVQKNEKRKEKKQNRKTHENTKGLFANLFLQGLTLHAFI